MATLSTTLPTTTIQTTVVKRATVIQQPAQVLYLVGPQVRVYADPQWAEFEAFKRWKAEQPTTLQNQTAIGTHCARCHTGTEAKAGFRVDQQMSSDAKLKAIRKFATGEMPPDRELNPADKNNLLTELTETEKEQPQNENANSD